MLVNLIPTVHIFLPSPRHFPHPFPTHTSFFLFPSLCLSLSLSLPEQAHRAAASQLRKLDPAPLARRGVERAHGGSPDGVSTTAAAEKSEGPLQPPRERRHESAESDSSVVRGEAPPKVRGLRARPFAGKEVKTSKNKHTQQYTKPHLRCCVKKSLLRVQVFCA